MNTAHKIPPKHPVIATPISVLPLDSVGGMVSSITDIKPEN